MSLQRPKLPLELECNIFTLALRNDRRNLKNLVLVAKRVHVWLIPEIFRVVIVHFKRFFPFLFELADFKKYGKHVRYLFLQKESAPSVNEILSCCPNVTTLMMHWEPNRVDIDIISKLPLQKLTISAPLFLNNLRVYSEQHPSARAIAGTGTNTYSPPICQGPPLFPTVTHIDFICEAFWRHQVETQSSILTYHFPSITHIAVPGLMMKVAELPPLFEKCKNLKILISQRPSFYMFDWAAATAAVQRERRLIFLQMERIERWMYAALGRTESIWEEADRAKAKASTIRANIAVSSR